VPIYQILLHGEGLKLLDQQGNKRWGGVYVWRTVVAENEVSAVDQAREDLLRDPDFSADLWNDSIDELVFGADKILEKASEEEAGDSGFVFYIDEAE
jgi:hypothetical protein